MNTFTLKEGTEVDSEKRNVTTLTDQQKEYKKMAVLTKAIYRLYTTQNFDDILYNMRKNDLRLHIESQMTLDS